MTTRTTRLLSAAAHSGFSLVELMVSMLIGTLLIAGALTVFVHSRIAWQSVENIAGLEERLAYALTEIEQDVRHAGNWGLHASSHLIAEPAGITVRCGGNDVSTWALDLSTAVAATNGLYDLPCRPYSGHVAESDTLTLRYAQPHPARADDDFIRLTSSTFSGILVDAGDTDESGNPLFNLAVRGWYLDRKSSEPDMPGLRRYTLVNEGLLQNQEIIPGIEDFQVSLGVDRDADGLIDGFINAAAADENESAGTVVAVRVWLLARTAAPEPGHADNGSWQGFNNTSIAQPKPRDGFRRQAAERTIWLRNQPEA